MDINRPLRKRNLLRFCGGAAVATSYLRIGRALGAPAGEPGAAELPLPSDVVYVNANISAEGANAVIGYRRKADGTLALLPGSPFRTGGTGFFAPNAALGVFDGDQQVIIDRGRGVLYASNSGSDTVAGFAIGFDGTLTALAGAPFATRGSTPTSLGLHENSLLVLDSNLDPAQSAGAAASVVLASITGQSGALTTLPRTLNRLPSGAGPTQVLTTNTAPFTFLCDFFGGTIRSFASVAYGSEAVLVPVDVQIPPQQAGATSVPKPLGLWASPNAPILYVGFPTTNQIGVYSWNEIGQFTFLRTAAVTGVAPCWLRTSPSGNRLYAVDTGNNSITTLDVTNPAYPIEITTLTVTGLTGRLVQPAISADGRFLYVLQRASNTGVTSPDSTLLLVFAVHAADGTLLPLSDATVALPVPPNTNPQGVVAL